MKTSFITASAFALLAMSSASAIAADRSQTVTSDGCILVAASDRADKVCATRLGFNNRFSLPERGYCELALTLRPDGSVKRVKTVRVKPRQELESVCIRSAYQWKFSAPENISRNALADIQVFTTISLGDYARTTGTAARDQGPLTENVNFSIDFSR